MDRILEDTFVPVFGSRKNIASVPLCWKELLSCLNFPPYWANFYFKKKKSQLLSVDICLLRIYFVTLRNEKPFSPFLPVNREPMRESSSLEYDIKTNYENEKIYSLPIIPNWSLDRYGTNRHWKDNFLSSFIFLLASCFSFVLDVARYAFEQTTNHLLNNQIKSVQNLMTDLGLSQ